MLLSGQYLFDVAWRFEPATRGTSGELLFTVLPGLEACSTRKAPQFLIQQEPPELEPDHSSRRLSGSLLSVPREQGDTETRNKRTTDHSSIKT